MILEVFFCCLIIGIRLLSYVVWFQSSCPDAFFECLGLCGEFPSVLSVFCIEVALFEVLMEFFVFWVGLKLVVFFIFEGCDEVFV